MSDKPEWVYVTKWALSDGINRMEVHRRWEDGVDVHGLSNCLWVGKEFAEDWPTAVAQAESMRARRIASLKKSIAKLERMTWTEPTTPTATSSGEATP